MRFVDSLWLKVSGGHGGAGAVAFRREKYVSRGGPSGGRGGRGGDVVLLADENVGTLLDLRYKREIRAENGVNGGTSLRDGRYGRDAVIHVPVGTLVRDLLTDELIADLNEHGSSMIVAAGGRGGLGNASFKSSVRQTPRFAQPGEPGEERTILLELKLLADVGIIGFPSVGKSTLISTISNAKPKIADYPFTTLVPNLGIVDWRDEHSFVVADIPGLIEGASDGAGLGLQFLRHVERSKILIHVLEVTQQIEGLEDGRDPLRDFETINTELEKFSEVLATRPTLVALNKMDLPYVAEREPELRAHFEGLGLPFVAFSAATRTGLQPLLDKMAELVLSSEDPDHEDFTIADVPEEVRQRAAEEAALREEEANAPKRRGDDDYEYVYGYDDEDEGDEPGEEGDEITRDSPTRT